MNTDKNTARMLALVRGLLVILSVRYAKHLEMRIAKSTALFYVRILELLAGAFPISSI